VDAGNLFPVSRYSFKELQVLAELGVTTLGAMNVRALNLGENEFSHGIDFLNHVKEKASFPFLAANLEYSGALNPFWVPYTVVEAGKSRIAFIGVLPPRLQENIAALTGEEGKNFQVSSPRSVLESLIPEVRKKADGVVLLSSCGRKETFAVVDGRKGLDLVIYCGNDASPFSEGGGSAAFEEKAGDCGGSGGGAEAGAPGDAPSGVPVYRANYMGKDLGYATLIRGETGKLVPGENGIVSLDRSVPGDPRIAGMIGSAPDDIYKKLTEEMKTRDADVDKRMFEEAKKLWKELSEKHRELMLQKDQGETK